MFCQNCGKEVLDGVKFCANCGAPQQVQEAPQPVAEPVAQPVVAPVVEQVAQPVVAPVVPPVAPPVSESVVPPVAPPVVQPVVPSAAPTVVPAAQSVVPPVVQPTVPQQGVYTQPVTPQPVPKKKGKGCLIAVFVLLGFIALSIVVSIINGIIQKVEDKNNPSDYSYNYDLALDDEDNAPVENPLYTDIFISRNIVDTPALFFTEETSAVANVDEDGMIEKIEFGHEDDVIKEMCDTIYYPIGEYTDAQIDAIDSAMRETMSVAEELDFCTVTYTITDDYYIVKIDSDDIDNALNLSALSDAGVVTYDGFATYLSLEATIESFIDQGYVTKYTVE